MSDRPPRVLPIRRPQPDPVPTGRTRDPGIVAAGLLLFVVAACVISLALTAQLPPP
jgi:hypothetical protein